MHLNHTVGLSPLKPRPGFAQLSRRRYYLASLARAIQSLSMPLPSPSSPSSQTAVVWPPWFIFLSRHLAMTIEVYTHDLLRMTVEDLGDEE